MPDRLDPSSEEPLFEQIASRIRWRISVAELKAGDPLPPTRDAAAEWGANRHTVARAYRLLVDAGLLRRGPRGVVQVAPTGAQERAGEDVVSKMVESIAREARKHGVALDRLAAHLLERPHSETVTAVECTADQCADLRRQIEAAWDVEVVEFCTTDEGEPPPGPFLSTLAHYEELRQRWPRRRRDEHFVPAATSPSLGPVLAHLAARASSGRVFVAVLGDKVGGSELCHELAAMSGLPVDRFQTIVAHDAREAAACAQRGELVLAATPHAHELLAGDLGSSPFGVRIHYHADPAALEGLAADLNWRRLPAQG